LPEVNRSHELQNDAYEDRKAFLSSFSPEEDKAIRRKVDMRFLWLIGLMYIIKNVSAEIRWLYQTNELNRLTTQMLQR
jgi:hypothetical protein